MSYLKALTLPRLTTPPCGVSILTARCPSPWTGGRVQIAPYQPRLDWQMWFAAMSTPDPNIPGRSIWFGNSCTTIPAR